MKCEFCVEPNERGELICPKTGKVVRPSDGCQRETMSPEFKEDRS